MLILARLKSGRNLMIAQVAHPSCIFVPYPSIGDELVQAFEFRQHRERPKKLQKHATSWFAELWINPWPMKKGSVIKDVIWWCCSTLKPETNLFLEKSIATQPWFNMFQTTKVYMSGTRSLLVVGIVAFVSACELKEFKNAAWQKSLPSPLLRPMPCMMHDVS